MSRLAKKSIIIPVIVILVIGVAIVVWQMTSNNSSDEPILNKASNSQESTNPDQGGSDETSADNGSISSPPEKTPGQQTPVKYSEPQDGQPSENEITGYITRSSVSDGTLQIRLTINQTVSSGTCTLTLTNQTSGETYTASADVITNPSSASCKGFDIKTNKLSSGNWDVSVHVTSGNKSGTITSSSPVRI